VEDTTTAVTLYVACPVRLPPLTAAAAFDVLVPGAAPVGAAPAIRRATARMALRRHRAVDVEIELVHRAGDWCEVGVRPCGRSVPVEGGPKREHYFDRALPLVTRLADAMVVTVDAWTALALRR
jgi:hypothetical protein